MSGVTFPPHPPNQTNASCKTFRAWFSRPETDSKEPVRKWWELNAGVTHSHRRGCVADALSERFSWYQGSLRSLSYCRRLTVLSGASESLSVEEP